MFSCDSNKPENVLNNYEEFPNVLASNEDYKIINSTFLHLLTPLPSGQENEREFGYDNFNQGLDKIPDEWTIEIYFTKYLVSVDNLNFDLKFSEKILSDIQDDSFKTLYKELFSENKLSSSLETSSIKNIGTYKIIPVELKEVVDREIGETVITYSRITYNKDKNMACFYFEDGCSGMCGRGMIVFVEKVEDVWTIKDELLVWLS